MNGNLDREPSEDVAESSRSALSRSLSTLVDTTLGGFLGWHSPTVAVVEAAKQHATSRLGVFIHRGLGLSTVQRIVFPYTGAFEEKSAFDTVINANVGVHVDIYALDSLSLEQGHPNVTVHHTADPLAAVIEVGKTGLSAFTLLVVGAKRTDPAKHVAHLIDRLEFSLLVIYNAATERNSRERLLDGGSSIVV